jgi:hypothetical protein
VHTLANLSDRYAVSHHDQYDQIIYIQSTKFHARILPQVQRMIPIFNKALAIRLGLLFGWQQ